MLRHKTEIPQIPQNILKEQQTLQVSYLAPDQPLKLQIPLRNQSPQRDINPLAKSAKVKDYKQRVQKPTEPPKSAVDKPPNQKMIQDSSRSKLASKRQDFSLKPVHTQRQINQAMPNKVDLSSDEDTPMPTYQQQGLVGCFTFGIDAPGETFKMMDYLWSREHYGESDTQDEGQSDCSVEIRGCRVDQKPPEYLRNIAGICYPEGLPQMSKVKFSTEAGASTCTFEQLNSQYKLVFYSTKKFSGRLNYLTILTCTRPLPLSETSTDILALLTPFAIVLVTSSPQFQSGLGSHILNLLYNTSILGYYQALTKGYSKVLRIEFHLALLFEVSNLMSSTEKVKLVQMDDQSQISMVQASSKSLQIDGLQANFSFKPFLAAPVDDICKLFACMLLEKKIILVADDADFQTQLALFIESLLALFEPLDAQVFTNITYAISADMVMYMDKPGSLIMGVSQSLWTQHGLPYWTNHSYDTYIVVYHIKERSFMSKSEDGIILFSNQNEMNIGLPRPIGNLLEQTLIRLQAKWEQGFQSMTLRGLVMDLECSILVKQAFFNTILLLVYTIGQIEAGDFIEADDVGDQGPQLSGFVEEFKRTTSYVDMSQRIKEQHPTMKHFSGCLDSLNKEGNFLFNFRSLIEVQSQKIKQLVDSLNDQDDQICQYPLEDLISCYFALNPNAFSNQGPGLLSKDAFFKLNKDYITRDLRTKAHKLHSYKLKKSHQAYEYDLKKSQLLKSHSQVQLQKGKTKGLKQSKNQGSNPSLNGIPPLARSMKQKSQVLQIQSRRNSNSKDKPEPCETTKARKPQIKFDKMVQQASDLPAEQTQASQQTIPLVETKFTSAEGGDETVRNKSNIEMQIDFSSASKIDEPEQRVSAEPDKKTSKNGLISFFANLFMSKAQADTQNTAEQEENVVEQELQQVISRRACKSQRIENDAQSQIIRKIQAMKNADGAEKTWFNELGKVKYLIGAQCLGVNDGMDNNENVPHYNQHDKIYNIQGITINQLKPQSLFDTNHDEIQNRAKTQSMQFQFNNRLLQKRHSNQKSPFSHSQDRKAIEFQELNLVLPSEREFHSLAKPQTTMNAKKNKGLFETMNEPVRPSYDIRGNSVAESDITLQLEERLDPNSKQAKTKAGYKITKPKQKEDFKNFVNSPVIFVEQKCQYHNMTFCDNPKDCQQCQLLALIGRVSLNSPKQKRVQTSKVPARPQRSPYSSARQIQKAINPDQQKTPELKSKESYTNLTQTVPQRKSVEDFQKDSRNVSPYLYVDKGIKLQVAQAKDSQVQAFEKQSHQTADWMDNPNQLLWNNNEPQKEICPYSFTNGDSPMLMLQSADLYRVESNTIPGSATEVMRQKYHSLFVRQFNAKDKIAPNKLGSNETIEEMANHDHKSDGTLETLSRLLTLQQEEGFSASAKEITIQDSSPIKSPKLLQTQMRPKANNQTKPTSTNSFASGLTTQVGSIVQAASKVGKPKISKPQQPSDQSQRKQPPITTVKKAHINLDGERSQMSSTQNQSHQSEIINANSFVMNNTSSFISQSSANQSSFIVAKEATASPIVNQDSTNTMIRKNVDSPRTLFHSAKPESTRQLVAKQLPLETRPTEIDQKTPTSQGFKTKITMHKSLTKQQSNLLKTQGNLLGTLKESNNLSKSSRTQRKAVQTNHFTSPFPAKILDQVKNAASTQALAQLNTQVNTQASQARQKQPSKNGQSLQLSDLIGKRTNEGKSPQYPVQKTSDHIRKSDEDGWSNYRIDNQMVLDLMEHGQNFKNMQMEFDQVYVSCSSKSNQDDTIDESHPTRRLIKNEDMKFTNALKRLDLDETSQLGQKQMSLFARPKAISQQSDSGVSMMHTTMRSSLPNQHIAPLNARGKVVQAGIKVNFGHVDTSQTSNSELIELNISQKNQKSRSTLLNSTEAIQQIIRRGQLKKEPENGPPKQR